MSCNELPRNERPCNALPWERLVAYVDGELSDAERDDAARHVDACAHCADEAELLRRSGALIERLPRLEPGDAFTERVLARVAADGARTSAPGGRLHSMWPLATVAAAVLVTAIAARIWWPGVSGTEGVLSAREEREIAADLYILANLDALEASDADELISLVEDLDLLEGTETEVSGLFGGLDDDESGAEGG